MVESMDDILSSLGNWILEQRSVEVQKKKKCEIVSWEESQLVSLCTDHQVSALSGTISGTSRSQSTSTPPQQAYMKSDQHDDGTYIRPNGDGND